MIIGRKDFKEIIDRLGEALPDDVFFIAVAQLMTDCVKEESTRTMNLMEEDDTTYEDEVSFVMSIVSMMIFSYNAGLRSEMTPDEKSDFIKRNLDDANQTFKDLLERISYFFQTGKTKTVLTSNIQKMYGLCQYKMREALVAKISEDLM
jgi:hypothetical protein